MIVNRRGLEAGHFHFEHAHTIILKDGVEAVIRLRFHRGAARGMVNIKIIFRNLSHEGSSDEQEEQREKNILGPHGTSKNVRGSPGPRKQSTNNFAAGQKILGDFTGCVSQSAWGVLESCIPS